MIITQGSNTALTVIEPYFLCHKLPQEKSIGKATSHRPIFKGRMAVASRTRFLMLKAG